MESSCLRPLLQSKKGRVFNAQPIYIASNWAKYTHGSLLEAKRSTHDFAKKSAYPFEGDGNRAVVFAP
jgi:hypothetical protein